MDRYATLRQGLVGAWCPSLGCGPVLANRGQAAILGIISTPTFSANGSGVAAMCNGTASQPLLSVSAPSMASFFGASASLTMWVKLTTATPSTEVKTGIMRCDNDITSTVATHYPYTDGKAYVSAWRTARVNGITLSSAVDRTRWHLLAVVTDGARWKMYQNDIVVSDQVAQSTVAFDPTTFTIARSFRPDLAGVYYLDGFWDDVRIYNRALTVAEIRLLASRRGIGLMSQRHRRAKIGSQLYANVGGVWKTATPWIKVGGVWKQATPSLNVSGTWK